MHRAIRALSVVVGSLAVANAAQAAIIPFADSLNQTGSYATFDDTFSVGGETSLYLLGTMTFDAVDGGGAALAELKTVDGAGVADIEYQIGQDGGAIFRNDYPFPQTVLDSSLTAGESHTFVYKINQTTGAWAIYFNPNLVALEPGTPDASGGGGSMATLEALQFRGIGSSVVDYTNFALFTGNDSPFLVPEPSSLAIFAVGLFGLGASRRRSRRQ